MSIKVMTWAWHQPVEARTKLVLMALADHADDDGICWPGLKKVAEKNGISDRAVQRHLVILQASGLLIVTPQFRPDGSQTTNAYQLNMTAASRPGAKMSPPPDAGDAGEPSVTGPVTRASPLEPSLEPSSNTTTPKTLGESLSPKLMPEDYPTWTEGFSRIEGLAPQTIADLVRIGRLPGTEPDIGCVLAFTDWWNRQAGKRKSIVATWRNWLKNEHKVLPFSDKPKLDRLEPGMVRIGYAEDRLP